LSGGSLCADSCRLINLVDPLIGTAGGDLMSVSPVTDNIVMLHIRDGHIITYGVHQGTEDNIVYHTPTDMKRAMNPANYVIISRDDPGYYEPRSPVNIGRKSKGHEYQHGWDDPPFIMQHWIYIELPDPMVQGKYYTVELNEITGNTNSYSFQYDVNRLRSETVRVNMVGFPENGQKVAYLSHWMGDFDTPVHRNGGLNLDNKTGAECRIPLFHGAIIPMILSGDLTGIGWSIRVMMNRGLTPNRHKFKVSGAITMMQATGTHIPVISLCRCT